jgi:hypothetical protein
VPQFPAVGGLGALLLVALFLPALVLMAKKFGKRPAQRLAS